LHLQAETLLELDGLPFPQLSKSVSPSSVRDLRVDSADFPAIELFTNRVERIHATANLDAQGKAVTQLCQLVGGLPLALELAATWTRVLFVTEIVAEIERSLDALTTTLHDVPQRHRSLRAVIDTSWELLDAAEQTLFRKLAVFRGGFIRSAAQAVAAATLPQLMSLVDRSFLRLDSDQRFRRHPLLLQFALEQLAAYPDELTAMRVAHAHFFADIVQAHETTLKQTESAETLAALAVDWDNIRTAWQWGLDNGDLVVSDRLVTGIGRFFASRGRPLEAAQLFEEGYETLQRVPNTPVSDRIIAKIEVELGYFWDQTGRLNEAEAILLRAEERTRVHEMTLTRIKCLRILGVVVDNQGKRELSRRYLEEAHQLCQTTDDIDQLLPILNALGNLCVSNAEFEQARNYFVEAMTLAEAMGNSLRMAVLHSNIAIIANRQKQYEEAIQEWRLAQHGFREHKHELGEANTIFNISMALHGLGRYDEALEHIQQAYTLLEKLGQRHGMAAGLGVMGMIYHKLGKPAAARRYLRDCVLLSHKIGSADTAIYGLAEVAEVEISAGNLQQTVFLLTFIIHHSATGGTARADAQKLLDELAAELPSKMVVDAQTAAAKHTLESMIAHLYGSK
jgi:tetratricopeptide (TPR) repeat protein